MTVLWREERVMSVKVTVPQAAPHASLFLRCKLSMAHVRWIGVAVDGIAACVLSLANQSYAYDLEHFSPSASTFTSGPYA